VASLCCYTTETSAESHVLLRLCVWSGVWSADCGLFSLTFVYSRELVAFFGSYANEDDPDEGRMFLVRMEAFTYGN